MQRYVVYITALLLACLVLADLVIAENEVVGRELVDSVHSSRAHQSVAVSAALPTRGALTENTQKIDRDEVYDDVEDDQLAPTWLMDGDAVYAATRTRYPGTYPSDALANPSGLHTMENEDGLDTTSKEVNAHTMARLPVASSSSTGEGPTLKDLALFVRIDMTNDEDGHIERAVQARVDASIGNIPTMDDNVQSKVAVALAAVLVILTVCAVVIM